MATTISTTQCNKLQHTAKHLGAGAVEVVSDGQHNFDDLDDLFAPLHVMNRIAVRLYVCSYGNIYIYIYR